MAHLKRVGDEKRGRFKKMEAKMRKKSPTNKEINSKKFEEEEKI